MTDPKSIRACAVVNPTSSAGRTKKGWAAIEPRLAAVFAEMETRFTDAPNAATRLAREALQQNFNLIIAVGGDGTINETVNGFLINDSPVNPHAALGILSSGTGSDFRRTFNLPDAVDDQVQHVIEGDERKIDLGKLTYIDHNGAEQIRYFDNIASFGLGGHVDANLNKQRVMKLFGGKAAFYVAMLKSALTYTNQDVLLEIDHGDPQPHRIKNVAICNGQYFGGSMHIAPHADPADGRFEIIIIGDTSLAHLLLKSNQVYTGAHMKDPQVGSSHGTHITATPADPSAHVLLDVDGEPLGRLPATFELLPNAITIRC